MDIQQDAFHDSRLTRQEKVFINSFVERGILKKLVFPSAAKLAAPPSGGRMLEIGCGEGAGAEYILENFQPENIVCLDIDSGQIARAQRRLEKYPSEQVSIIEADIRSHGLTEAEFDAVFTFNMLHHIIEWKDVLGEISRLLKPGGVFYMGEPVRIPLVSDILKILVKHPKEAAFSRKELKAELEAVNMEWLDHVQIPGIYVILAARKITT